MKKCGQFSKKCTKKATKAPAPMANPLPFKAVFYEFSPDFLITLKYADTSEAANNRLYLLY